MQLVEAMRPSRGVDGTRDLFLDLLATLQTTCPAGSAECPPSVELLRLLTRDGCRGAAAVFACYVLAALSGNTCQ